MEPTDHYVAGIHQERNRRTRGDCDSFRSHREQITRILVSLCKPSHSLLILGAGNGNDVDLEQLSTCYESITLVDLDHEAIEHCLSGLSLQAKLRVTGVAPFDVSGIVDCLPDRESSGGTNLSEVIDAARVPAVASLPLCDVVVSTCLISQLIDSVHVSVDESHPQQLELVLAVRDGHLNLLRQLTKPDGTTLLVTDFVSSDTLPQLPMVGEEDLLGLLTTAVNQHNFFTGLNPAVLIQGLSGQTPLPPKSVHPPWRWQMGPRTFGVIGIETNWH